MNIANADMDAEIVELGASLSLHSVAVASLVGAGRTKEDPETTAKIRTETSDRARDVERAIVRCGLHPRPVGGVDDLTAEVRLAGEVADEVIGKYGPRGEAMFRLAVTFTEAKAHLAFKIPYSPNAAALEELATRSSIQRSLVDQWSRDPATALDELRAHVRGRRVGVVPPDIASGFERFHEEHASARTAFIMMSFAKTRTHTLIHTELVKTLTAHGVCGLRADGKDYMADLLPNVRVYMHACDFGVAVFERIEGDDFNPNISLEVGYMTALGKHVLLLKDRSLRSLPTDLMGRLYSSFDSHDVPASIPGAVRDWFTRKGL